MQETKYSGEEWQDIPCKISPEGLDKPFCSTDWSSPKKYVHNLVEPNPFYLYQNDSMGCTLWSALGRDFEGFLEILRCSGDC